MTTKEKIELMIAYLNGQVIQYRTVKNNGKWYDIRQGGKSEPTWNWFLYEYRIKPKLPVYRPYKSANEFLKAREEHGSHIEACGKYYLPIMVDRDKGILVYSDTGDEYVLFDEVLRYYKWQDGTPCGIMEE